jgi:hypothetical protein
MGAEGNLEGRLFSIVGAISLDSGAVSGFRNLVVDLGVLSTLFFLVVKVPLLMEVLDNNWKYWNKWRCYFRI